MDYGKQLEKLMGMSDETWKRHANPWSVWTRFVILPFLALAIWSRIWFGWWCLVPIAILLFWTVINPRFFGKPETTDHWASKATFGERVWLNKAAINIPGHHIRAANILNMITALGLVPLIYGLLNYDLLAVLLGLCMVILGKLWFLDRMVWLFEEMKGKSKEYEAWLY